jgi:predicted transcriptional regulator
MPAYQVEAIDINDPHCSFCGEEEMAKIAQILEADGCAICVCESPSCEKKWNQILRIFDMRSSLSLPYPIDDYGWLGY